jgi:hypothetical protein
MSAARFKRLEAKGADAGFSLTFDFIVETSSRTVTGAAWLPASGTPKALVLVGHGGSQHKRHGSVSTVSVIGDEGWRFHERVEVRELINGSEE